MKRRVVWLALVVFLAASCQSSPNFEEPPEIRYGEDTCDRCSMIINEARYAASFVTGTGDVYRFEEIGEMLAYVAEQPRNVTVFWVHDYDTEKWLKAREAFFVAGTGLRTPMGFGIVAVGEQVRAESLAVEKEAAVYSFETLMLLAAAGDMEPAHDGQQPVMVNESP
jgi:copper chaperone NosL